MDEMSWKQAEYEREQRKLGEAYADPNAHDDAKVGKSFEETNSSRRKKHEVHLKEKFEAKGNRRILLWFVIAVVVLFGLVFVLAIIPRRTRDKENEKKAEEAKGKTPVVLVETVKRDGHSEGLVLPGTTTPLVEAYVFARANGYLKTRLVDIGDHVRKGQLLAVVDSPDLDAQVAQAKEQVRQAESQVAQQKTQLALTKITWDRWRVLVAKGVFARQDGDQKEADYLAAEANVSAAERNAEAFRANLQRVLSLQSYEQVRAPFDGVITARNVDVGALISAAGSTSGGATGPSGLGGANTGGSSGSSPNAGTATGGGDGSGAGALFSVAQVQRLRVLVAVPEGYAPVVKPGQKTVMHFQEYPKQEFPADVTRTAGSIDQNTRTLLTEVQVDNRDGKLLSGMYVVVTFDAVGGAGAIMIPGDAIVVRQNTTQVALIQNGTVTMRPVEIGRDLGEAVEIVRGLNDGDVIATSVTDEVREGAKVQTREQPAAKKAPVVTNTPPGGSSQYGDQSITDPEPAGAVGAVAEEAADESGQGIGEQAVRARWSCGLALLFGAAAYAQVPDAPQVPSIAGFVATPTGKAAVVGAEAGSKVRTARSEPTGLGFSFYGVLGPYHRAKVPPLFAGSDTRLMSLIRDGKLYLSLHDAIALAVENNLDVEVERYNLQLAETDALRARGGGSLRGIDYTVQAAPNGVGGPGSPLLNTGATNPNPTVPSVTDLTSLNSTTQQAQNFGQGGTGLTPAAGPSIPLFDPSFILTGGYLRRSDTVTLTGSTTGTPTQSEPLHYVTANVAYLQGFSSGAQLEATANNDSQVIYSTQPENNPFYSPSTSVTLTQPLLRGRGREVNLRYVRIANLDKKVSRLLFDQQVQQTVYGISRLYFDLVSLGESVAVKQEALRAAQKLRKDDADQVIEGTLAPMELTRASALVSTSEFDLVQAQGLYRQQEVILRNQMLRMASPVFAASFTAIVPTDRIVVPDLMEPLAVPELIAQGLARRPDLAQAEVQLRAGQVTARASRNEALPQLNVYANVETRGSSEQAYEQLGSPGTGIPTIPQNLALGGLRTSTIYQAGVQMTLPVRNRVAASDAARDTVLVRQAEARTEKLSAAIRQDIENAVIALQTAYTAYNAARNSTGFQQQFLQAELDKLGVGASTNLQVIQDETYVAQAKSTEIAARSNWKKAQIELERALGTLLEENRIGLDDAVRGALPQ